VVVKKKYRKREIAREDIKQDYLINKQKLQENLKKFRIYREKQLNL